MKTRMNRAPWIAMVIGLAILETAGTDRVTVGPLTIEQIQGAGAGVWRVIQKKPVWSNSLLVEAADGTLILCDTPMSEAATVHLLRWARERFGDRDWVVVNAHFHPDCTAGNAAMIDAGADVWASSRTAELLKERGQEFLDALATQNAGDPALARDFRNTRLALPTHIFDPADIVQLPIAGERVVVLFPGPAHSPDNVVTFFEDRGLLFAGCLCLSAERDRPGYLGDADVESWPASVRNVEALGAQVVVPGHGAPGGPELLRHTAEVVRSYAKKPGDER